MLDICIPCWCSASASLVFWIRVDLGQCGMAKARASKDAVKWYKAQQSSRVIYADYPGIVLVSYVLCTSTSFQHPPRSGQSQSQSLYMPKCVPVPLQLQSAQKQTQVCPKLFSPVKEWVQKLWEKVCNIKIKIFLTKIKWWLQNF